MFSSRYHLHRWHPPLSSLKHDPRGRNSLLLIPCTIYWMQFKLCRPAQRCFVFWSVGSSPSRSRGPALKQTVYNREAWGSVAVPLMPRPQ
ncbi:hypothetical protein PENSPDRAFT_399075 [Peniophora sp. CONT]|nr:hypothetical protein PENSPDRAFT_399075 [Peniophora sp. CONT]